MSVSDFNGNATVGVVLEDGVYKVAIEFPGGDMAVIHPKWTRRLAADLVMCAEKAEELQQQRAQGAR